jgi:hypothetical protein
MSGCAHPRCSSSELACGHGTSGQLLPKRGLRGSSTAAAARSTGEGCAPPAGCWHHQLAPGWLARAARPGPSSSVQGFPGDAGTSLQMGAAQQITCEPQRRWPASARAAAPQHGAGGEEGVARVGGDVPRVRHRHADYVLHAALNRG